MRWIVHPVFTIIFGIAYLYSLITNGHTIESLHYLVWFAYCLLATQGEMR